MTRGRCPRSPRWARALAASSPCSSPAARQRTRQPRSGRTSGRAASTFRSRPSRRHIPRGGERRPEPPSAPPQAPSCTEVEHQPQQPLPHLQRPSLDVASCSRGQPSPERAEGPAGVPDVRPDLLVARQAVPTVHETPSVRRRRATVAPEGPDDDPDRHRRRSARRRDLRGPGEAGGVRRPRLLAQDRRRCHQCLEAARGAGSA